MKSVIVRGPLLSESGYGNHARQIFRWILSNHSDSDIRVQVLLWGNTSWCIDPDAESGLIGEIMKRSGPAGKKFDVSFQIQLPNEWDSSLANTNVGISAIVESDVCNHSWIDACNRMSVIIVPSEFCEKTLRNTGDVTTPIHVVPESFIPEVLSDRKEIDVDFDTSFNFLTLVS